MIKIGTNRHASDLPFEFKLLALGQMMEQTNCVSPSGTLLLPIHLVLKRMRIRMAQKEWTYGNVGACPKAEPIDTAKEAFKGYLKSSWEILFAVLPSL